MASGTSVDALVEANRALRKLSDAEVADFFASLDLSKPDVAKVQMLRVMPQIVFKYGEIAASLAADLYEDWRSGIREAAKYRALMADMADLGTIEASTRYAIGGLYREPADTAAVLTLLQGDVVARNVRNQGRETMALNVQADPAEPRWARIPVGETCEWCLMLGSRGFKPGLGYRSEITAAAASHGGTCDCEIVPEFATGDLIESYDPDAVYDQWKTAKANREAAEAAKAEQSSR